MAKKKQPKAPGGKPAPPALLPSQVVAGGGPLTTERAQQLRALRDLLGDRPETFSPEEWAVVHALLDPDRHAYVLQGRPNRQMYSAAARARACFPGLSTSSALVAFQRAAAQPHVREVVEAVSALEAIDVVEHRSMVRSALHSVLGTHQVLQQGLAKADPHAAAKLGLTVVAAGKALMELDALALPKEEPESFAPNSQDPFAALNAEVERVTADLAARRPIDVEVSE